MSVRIEVPRLAESISEAVLVEWLKENGAAVRTDEPVATLETDKAAVEIAAPAAGKLTHTRKAGDTVLVGDVLGEVEPGADGAASTPNGAASAPAPPTRAEIAGAADAPGLPKVEPPTAGKSASSPPEAEKPAGSPPAAPPPVRGAGDAPPMGPAARKMASEQGIDPATVEGTGPRGRVLKEDVMRKVEGGASPAPAARPAAASAPAPAPQAPKPVPTVPAADAGEERVVPMTRIRQRIAERLVRAQHTAAILTTFNEIDMSAVMDLRSRYKDAFEKKHGVKLGFMSLFGPEINAEIRGTDLVYKSHAHLGVAVGTDRGLVVPVVKRADTLSLAELEREIGRLAGKARDGTLTIDELSGGTFTISNGGVYGSLMSTPILNPPQSGILGMHKIEKRPIALNDAVVIRPMMYVALSYDHRVVDGEQAVTFLVRVKERLEDPERMLLEV